MVAGKPELLAPAGNAAAALAAFDAGADAIYAGLPKFNARERGENFSADELGRVIRYGHRLGKKIYVTMNTLVKEAELPEIVEYLAELEQLEPDALIIQDLGVLRLAREYFPRLALHASTQMGFHNLPALQLAKRMGVSRVILERQVTMEELELLAKDSPVELEVFVHGALCCSLSGQCLFSSWLGGASGNRGKCKQPCRRRFFQQQGNGFFFSTGDLCSLEMIPQLTQMGIRSFKIEGRLRQPDYVYNTVQAYRMIVDADTPKEAKERTGEARRILSESCGRRWTQGFFTAESMKELVRHDTMGAAGMLVGRVEKLAPNGFGFVAKRRIRQGDRLRVQPTSGDEGPALTLTRILVNDRPAMKVSPGEYCFICCDKEVPYNGLVFKLGTNLEVTTARLDQYAEKPLKLDLNLQLFQNKLQVGVGNAPTFPPWEYAWDLAPMQTRDIDSAAVVREFCATDRSGFEVRTAAIKITGSHFLPASVLKAARREFWEHAAAHLIPAMVDSPELRAMEAFRQDYLAMQPAPSETELETVAIRPHGNLAGNPKAHRAVSILDFNKTTDEVILPEFCPQARIASLEKMIRAAYEANIRRFRITGLYALELFKNYPDATLLTSFPLPVSNSLAAKELQRFRVQRVQADIELEKSAIDALQAKSPLPVEIYRYGRPALLVTRATLPVEGYIKDLREQQFLVRFDKRSGLTRLYSSTVLSLPRVRSCSDYYDLTQANWQEKQSGDFNFNGAWQ